ncbi:MAG: hypothetical protein K6E55_10675 [Thermoguttaceae bacterium]|nr:hypothetical protein [Thermoguttaceae bacterium]
MSDSRLPLCCVLFGEIPLAIRKKAIAAAEIYADLTESERFKCSASVRQSIENEIQSFGRLCPRKSRSPGEKTQ